MLTKTNFLLLTYFVFINNIFPTAKWSYLYQFGEKKYTFFPEIAPLIAIATDSADRIMFYF